MATECYYSNCRHHCCNSGQPDGPFCDEPECLASPEHMAQWQIERDEQLERQKTSQPKFAVLRDTLKSEGQ